MTRPRAAVFCRRYLPYSETFIYDELRSHTRWDVDVFTRVRDDDGRFPYASVLAPTGPLARLAYRATTYSPAFAHELRARRVRLVHAHFGTSAVYAHTYHRLLGLPLVVTFHGYDVGALVGRGRYAPKLWRYWALARTILARAQLLLCASEELCQLVSELSGRPEAVRLYRLGIDVAQFQPRSERVAPPRVIMIGRFVEKKGHLDGIAAFARVVGRGVDARLVIVGDGALAPAYRRAIAEHRIADRVELAGVRPHAEVARLVAESTVLLAPSVVARDGDRDSGILVAKEAAACAVPTIGTTVAGLPEIVEDGRTGYLVPPGDVAALADRLHQVLRAPALAAELGAAARAKMLREYALPARVAVLEDFYDEVAGLDTRASTT